jgi:hypothetical protein
MVSWRSTISVLIGALAFAAVVRADLTPMSRSESQCRPSPCVSDCIYPQPADCSEPHAFLTGLFEANSLPLGSLPEVETAAGQTCEVPPVRPLTENQDSLSLCLWGLISAGVFRSVFSIRNLSLGFIPDWYHDGGPVQIGHSFAVGPDLHLMPVYCFVQPDYTGEDHLPQHYRGIIVSLWRMSQFVPAVLASRGPPA